MRVNGPRASVVLIAPDVTENVFAAEDLVGVHHEELQQRQLATGQVDADQIDQNVNSVEPRVQVSAAVFPDRRLIVDCVLRDERSEPPRPFGTALRCARRRT